ncbi:MAG: hypothetical protein LBL82_07820 [Oscillospiraceae bacterium]|nr:hypothetical protein [Oscillospiraceae bacterium]
MKKTLIVMLCFFIFSLSACSQKYESAEKIDSYGDQPSILNWEDIAFTEYHTIHTWAGEKLPDDVKIGKQIAIANEDNKEKLFEIEGFSTDEWVIVYSNALMSEEYIIYKADSVEAIPPELELSNFQ